MVEDLHRSWNDLQQRLYERERQREEEWARERREREAEGERQTEERDAPTTYARQVESLCELARRYGGAWYGGEESYRQRAGIEAVLSNVPEHLRRAVRTAAMDRCLEYLSLETAMLQEELEELAREDEPEPTPIGEGRGCYRCPSGEFLNMTAADAQAAGCTKDAEENCYVPTEDLPFPGRPTQPPVPLVERPPVSTPTSQVTPGASVPLRPAQAPDVELPPVSTPSAPVSTPSAPTSPAAPQTQPVATPSAPAAAPTATPIAQATQTPIPTQYSWGGEELVAQAEAAAAACPPGQFWDGTKCRGAIDYEGMAQYGSLPTGGAPGVAPAVTTPGMPTSYATIAGRQHVSRKVLGFGGTFTPFGGGRRV